ncbi:MULTISPECIES: tRNA (adenine(22)-N(1))-methyltransferase TrmK [unclassified Enterococcus]|uniref:tRNA (adenine(22)-N(1))-methyltransferase n=1 Tax=unclassified Enterococcus TaxID=2608891 RepID=UPI001553AD58|nr:MULTISPECIES: tRNA (adenine(22)-N(1))-methyltransferase TrmK [unclassified Enterococcus]MBS7576527.1 tRNA (adenine-N(1))-methyltransferase [Enterococcus sp. MMGLQ5-2]MBS7583986.1 tRNA (adenine-N(1))-methyltransferase [Enterococcus sp. MMGLQ5-1]NPD11847.1 tRNA (adenine-N(1))-methyltransferase [Enterococcus sp. MMGLQ5-1]NPD36364.1 tRNA (adenine-N(1))-methyltransferase [Enterococcus sp. MMGLQ5-2]
MNSEKLSKRLETVAGFVPQNARLADIGSDHAYLPVYLTKTKQISYAIAGEVVKGPFESAKKEVEAQGLASKIKVRLADGLAAIQPEDEIDTVTIAGMGGQLISEILNADLEQLINVKRLILQPNVGECGLRRWLNQNGYHIVAESILQEHQKIYEVIVVEKGQQALNEHALLFGPFLMQEKSTVFIKKWQQELENKERVLKKLKQAKQLNQEKVAQFSKEITWIRKLII